MGVDSYTHALTSSKSGTLTVAVITVLKWMEPVRKALAAVKGKRKILNTYSHSLSGTLNLRQGKLSPTVKRIGSALPV